MEGQNAGNCPEPGIDLASGGSYTDLEPF